MKANTTPVPPICSTVLTQQYSNTVKWWYQCRNMTGFFLRRSSTVSKSSKILDHTKLSTAYTKYGRVIQLSSQMSDATPSRYRINTTYGATKTKHTEEYTASRPFQ